jgi:tetratricopeptide (TPR) repeat protein
MRFAFILEPPPAGSGVDKLAVLRLAVARAGFNVVRLRFGGTMRKDLARAIDAADDEDSVLLYVAGDVNLVRDSVVLALEPPLPLADIATLVCGRPLAHLLIVVDGRANGDQGDALFALEHIEAITKAVDARERKVELLAAVESSPTTAAPAFALTRFFVNAIEDASSLAPDGTMRMSVAYAKMTENPEFASSVPSFVHVKGASDFVVVAPIAERASEPPSSRSPLTPVRSVRVRSLLPMPAIEPILAEAERAQAAGDWEKALDGYRKALMLLGEGEPRAVGSLYASMAEVKLGQGKTREAEALFEKALGASPDHARSLETLLKMALGGQAWSRAASLERRIARTLRDEKKQIETLARSAELYEKGHDLPKAVEVLEEARLIRPTEPVLLLALRAGYEALKQWRKVVDIVGAMAEAAPLLHDKAQLRFEQADVLLGRLRDEEVGLAVLGSTLDDDPTHERAMAAIVAVHTRREEWRAIERLYAKQIEVFAAREDVQRSWELCKKLGQVRRDKLNDGPGALEAFTGAVKLRPKDVETRAALAELLVAKGDRDAAIAELEMAAKYDPARAETHRRLFDLHRRAGSTDRTWLAATALEALGAASVDHAALAAQFRGETHPTGTLDDAAWALLRAPGADAVIEAMTRAIAPAAIAVKLEQLRAEGRLPQLDPAKRQLPDSAAPLVRAFGASAQLLGVRGPDLYAQDGTDGALAAVQAPEPASIVSPAAMSGKKAPELAFVAARHLAYYRPEYYAVLFYPSLVELTALVLAAVKLARPELPLPANPASAVLRKALAPMVGEARKAELVAAVDQLDARGGRLDLAAWLTSVELTANRAGLLVSGDLAAALAAMRGEARSFGEVTFDDRRADLLAFTESRSLADLRARLGVAAKAALPPPPPSTERLTVN